jgi:hypothetical protein
MKTSCGHPRKLTDRQIREVLKWHEEAIEFRRKHGTVRDLAILLGVSLHAVRGCFEVRKARNPKKDGIQAPHSPGRSGRPQHLNPAQIAFAIAWRDAGRHFYARHGSVGRLARQLGVGASTIHDCIRRKGRYTQRAQPDIYKESISHLSHQSMLDESLRSGLLRAWLRRVDEP